MATILSFLSGRQITNNNGSPQSGALLYHYDAGTTTNHTVYSNQAGTTAHAQPVVCDSGGFVPLIYVDSTSDWKVLVRTSAGVTLQTYDNLAAAPTAVTDAAFAPPLFSWNQVTSASSPVTLTAANAGNAYEADTTSGSITFNLPSAASVGNGKGFLFKKTNASNSIIIDASGSETIDGSLTFTFTQIYQTFAIFSNGATWYRTFDVPVLFPTFQSFTTGTGTYTPATGVRLIKVRMVGGGGGGAAQTANNGSNGTASSYGSWTAIQGSGGVTQAAGGAGGTGGAAGTGTLIARFDGQNGGHGSATAGIGGAGGSSVFGGGAAFRNAANAAGVAGKTNTGGGGSGGQGAGAANTGGGGGGGEYVEFFVSSPVAITYVVGAGGAGGVAGTLAGGAGAAGYITIEEFY